MYIILWLALGGIAGWIASMIVKDSSSMGIFANIAVGLIGSFIGGWIASLIGLGTFNTFSIGGLLIAIVGSVVFLLVVNMFRKNTHT